MASEKHSTFAGHLADWSSRASIGELPSEAVTLIKRAFLDTIAVTLSGSQLDSSRIVLGLSEDIGAGDPVASIVGRGRKADLLTAALANGTAAHAELFDDNNEPMISHPSAVLVSSLLALGQKHKVSGREILNAYLAGFEINVGLSRQLNPGYYERGWHVTRTLGLIGATASCCRLIGLPPDAVRHALGIAATMASGMRQNFGTMAMALHAGLTARDAIHAALLAGKGFRSDDEALEGRYGYFNLFAGTVPDLPPLGKDYEIVRSGLIFKPYPSGAPTHAAVDAAIELSGKLNGDTGKISKIICHVHPHNFMTLREGVPRDTLRARVNMQYCIAASLRFGRLDSDQFTMAAVEDQEVARLMAITEMRVSDALPDNGFFPAAVDVFLEGETEALSARYDAPLGSPPRPMSPERMNQKFTRCADGVISSDKAEAAMQFVLALETKSDITALCEMLE
ncbi:MmgE/PrpD family protein [Chelatococcus asaccharovorans]|uniref:2-methylcitrate dehydratase PrpD n=1 Tax=Chelatococcus asaccharovorans TaxID=28210 RepID=A0A2V3TXR9_9HYPH|nr:MmgE/PrpD family protein [Chelatococcus asaccharovorans]MBS7707504.1 MmgE/PrpD family protein [Chelatococcus asaccharovorans]PXW54176.1 2-methylcitrate dehydratase PrpD [Chelatococcus asaccharovorans]